MALRYAILGALTSAPSSGYELARLFDTGLGSFWSAAHSQIYPELRRSEGGALLESPRSRGGEKLERGVSSVPRGALEQLEDGAGGPPLYRPLRDPERVQLIFSDLLDVPAIR